MVKKKIAIVDDNLSFLDKFEQIISNSNYIIERYCNPVSASIHLQTNSYEIILLDECMPHISGIELANLLQEKKPAQHIAIMYDTLKQNKSYINQSCNVNFIKKDYDSIDSIVTYLRNSI